MSTKFCIVELNICGSSVWKMRHVTVPVAPRILRWLLVFQKVCTPLM